MKPITAFIAPHRTGFLLGTLVFIAALLWWTLEIVARQSGAGSVFSTAMPAMFLHGYLMLYGFFPLFMLGFIYTAGPRWLGVPPPRLAAYVPVMVGYAAGSLLVLASVRFAFLLPFGIALHALAWSGALALWIGRMRESKAPDRWHAALVASAFALGLCGQACALLWSSGIAPALWQTSVEIGLWGFLLPVFLTVCHRMLPFFSSSVLAPYTIWNPPQLLFALVGLSWAHGALALFGVATWPVDLPFAALLATTSWRWGLVRSFKVPLLAMLHAAFAWASLALALYAAQGIAAALGHAILGFAPLHALTLGFFATMLLGFVTRVSLGHSGRPLVAGRFAWTLYWMMHGVAATRVVADLIMGWQQAMYLSSVLGALIAFLLWGTRFVPIYLLPRADGGKG